MVMSVPVKRYLPDIIPELPDDIPGLPDNIPGLPENSQQSNVDTTWPPTVNRLNSIFTYFLFRPL